MLYSITLNNFKDFRLFIYQILYTIQLVSNSNVLNLTFIFDLYHVRFDQVKHVLSFLIFDFIAKQL